MSHFLTYKSKYPSSIHAGPQVNPWINDMDSSPCKMRPDTKKPCPRLKKTKEHDACLNCYWVGKGKCKDPLTWEPKPIAKPTFQSKLKINNCAWPGCPSKTRGKHCGFHASHYNNRRKAHIREHGDDVELDLEWVYRPIQPNGRRRK